MSMMRAFEAAASLCKGKEGVEVRCVNGVDRYAAAIADVTSSVGKEGYRSVPVLCGKQHCYQ